ncbi:peptigoglycan-binding protein LysM, partial [bacterium M00.F.Ca.ET.168.01.1.1]
MAINPSKAFLFAAGGVAVVAAVAYGSGALDPYINNQKPAPVATLPQAETKPAGSSSTTTEA